jgi:invasion protein IalB
MNIRLPIAWIFVVCVTFPAGGAEAPAEAVAGALAGSVVERHRDWLLDCRAGCLLATEILGPAGERLLRLSLAADHDALVVETSLPLHLPDGLILGAGEQTPITVPWRTCGGTICEARAVLDDAILSAFRRERTVSVALTLVGGERVRLPVSLLGFTAGERALRAAGAGG